MYALSLWDTSGASTIRANLTTMEKALTIVSWQKGFKCHNSLINSSIAIHYLPIPVVSWIQFIIKQPTSSTGITNRIFVWHKISFFARWISPGLVTVLCFNLQPTTIESFQLVLKDTINSTNLCDPYSYFIPLISEVSSLFDTSIWSMRDIVRFTELVSFMKCFMRYF